MLPPATVPSARRGSFRVERSLANLGAAPPRALLLMSWSWSAPSWDAAAPVRTASKWTMAERWEGRHDGPWSPVWSAAAWHADSWATAEAGGDGNMKKKKKKNRRRRKRSAPSGGESGSNSSSSGESVSDPGDADLDGSTCAGEAPYAEGKVEDEKADAGDDGGGCSLVKLNAKLDSVLGHLQQGFLILNARINDIGARLDVQRFEFRERCVDSDDAIATKFAKCGELIVHSICCKFGEISETLDTSLRQFSCCFAASNRKVDALNAAVVELGHKMTMLEDTAWLGTALEAAQLGKEQPDEGFGDAVRPSASHREWSGYCAARGHPGAGSLTILSKFAGETVTPAVEFSDTAGNAMAKHQGTYDMGYAVIPSAGKTGTLAVEASDTADNAMAKNQANEQQQKQQPLLAAGGGWCGMVGTGVGPRQPHDPECPELTAQRQHHDVVQQMLAQLG